MARNGRPSEGAAVDARAPGPALSAARAGGAIALALWLAWHAVTAQLATAAVATLRADVALAINPRSAAAATVAGVQALAAGRVEAAQAQAVNALRRTPMNAAALRTLALAASRRGDDAAAGRLMGIGAALGWRDAPMQLWLADRLIAGGSYDQGLLRIDALLRQQTDRHDLFRLLNAVAQVPAARAALIARLAVAPDWRYDFMHDSDALGAGDDSARVALIDALRRTPAPPTRDELAPFIGHLIAGGHDAAARALWLRTVARRALVAPSGLYDGGFAAGGDAAAFPFEWLVPEDAAGVAAIEPAGEAGGGGLHVVASGTLPETLVSQRLLLVPGGYALSYRSDAGSGAALLSWQIGCAGQERWLTPLDGAIAATGTVRFVVPAGCGVQTLMLRARQADGAGPTDVRIGPVALARARG